MNAPTAWPPCHTEEVSSRELTRSELDRRLEDAYAAVTGGIPADRPQFISAGELVRRIRPFLGWN